MEILFVSPEIVPFSKTGGVADIAAALPKALKALGHRVHVLSLLYGHIDPARNSLARRLTRLPVALGNETIAVDLYEARLPSGVQVTLLNAPGLTDRPKIYGEPDDARRFALLARGAVEWIRAQPRTPDLVHAFDWAAALTPLYLQRAAQNDGRLANIKTVFTAHNFAWQGLFGREVLAQIGLPESLFSPSGVEFYGKFNWLKAGLVFADRLTTVSPSYAREVLSGAQAAGLEGVVRSRGKDFQGILNGVDYALWNPTTDPHIAARFDAEGTDGRVRCKQELANYCGLPFKPGVPLFGFVGRLETQKGFDLLLAAVPRLLRNEMQLAILGEGDESFAQAATELAKRFPERVHFQRGFDEVHAHRVYAGADFLLSPSRFEPSGLAVMYGLRYGAIPIAQATGGVNDTVVDCDSRGESGTGFLYEGATEDGLVGAVGRALGAFRTQQVPKIRRRAMRKDLSWDRSARQYQSLYAALAGVRLEAGAV